MTGSYEVPTWFTVEPNYAHIHIYIYMSGTILRYFRSPSLNLLNINARFGDTARNYRVRPQFMTVTVHSRALPAQCIFICIPLSVFDFSMNYSHSRTLVGWPRKVVIFRKTFKPPRNAVNSLFIERLNALDKYPPTAIYQTLLYFDIHCNFRYSFFSMWNYYIGISALDLCTYDLYQRFSIRVP